MAKYDFLKIEKKYAHLWQKHKIYEPDFKKTKNPFYNLMMFPYPSAEGLHVGNMYAFTGADVFGRFQRMKGNDVFEPIGLDGFGIHSENYALKIGAHPMKQAVISQKRFYKQLEKIGNGFSWNEKLETYDPNYYQFTQWIFIQMWKAGLAYRKKQAVNWCLSCKTVLADEQVIGNKCERCGTVIERRELEQWFFKITKYADKLLDNLDKMDWSEQVKIAQKRWIGRSEGVIFKHTINDLNVSIETFSAHFECCYADTFIIIAPDHDLIKTLIKNSPQEKEISNFCKQIIFERKKMGEKLPEMKGIFTGRYAHDPLTNKNLPIWIANYAINDYGTGAVRCSAHDERDFNFAQKYKIPLKAVLFPANSENYEDIKNCKTFFSDEENGILSEPSEFKGRKVLEIRDKMIDHLALKKVARKAKSFHLRDWLVSRQRYWGVPIPMVFCSYCFSQKRGERKEMHGWYSVSEKKLPVVLPYVKNFKPIGTGDSPLASVKSFYEVNCPQCGKRARRETDVADTFLDSSWYYLGYLMASKKWKMNLNSVTIHSLIKKWCPVDMYIGGAEHSVLHLLYVRFIGMALKDMKYISFDEPIKKFRTHGLLIKDGAKMSKSKGNVIVPDEYMKRFGADAFRMYLMFLAPFEEGGDFQDRGIMGTARFLERTWRLGVIAMKNNSKTAEIASERILHQTIKKVTEDIEKLHYNTAISSLMTCLNEFEKSNNISRIHFGSFLKLLAPFAPFITEELWHIGKTNKKFSSIHKESWPSYDVKKILEKSVRFIVQINGKVRSEYNLNKGMNESEVMKMILQDEKIKKFFVGGVQKRVVFIPDKLLNFVIEYK